MKGNLLIKYGLIGSTAFLFTLGLGITNVYAVDTVPMLDVSAIQIKGNELNFQWVIEEVRPVAKTKEELINQYVNEISKVSEDLDTFTISLSCDKEIYDWVVNKAINYNSLPTKNNPIIQNSYHIHRISPKPYYAGDNVRRFDLLISTGKNLDDNSVEFHSIKTTKKVGDLARKVAGNINNLDDKGKLNYIDDWVAYHFNYDNSLTKFTAADGYRTGEFVCAGYTEMFKLISDYAGLENKVEVAYGEVNVEGANGSHSWIIYVDDSGNRFLIDPTHNDYQRTTKSCKKWFMLDESTVRGYTRIDALKPLQNIFDN